MNLEIWRGNPWLEFGTESHSRLFEDEIWGARIRNDSHAVFYLPPAAEPCVALRRGGPVEGSFAEPPAAPLRGAGRPAAPGAVGGRALQALVPPGRRELDNEVHVEELQRLRPWLLTNHNSSPKMTNWCQSLTTG